MVVDFFDIFKVSKITVKFSDMFKVNKKPSMHCLTLFRMEGGSQKGPPTSFSPVTFTNVGINLQNFLTFSFNPFDRLVQNFKFEPSVSPKLLNLNQNHPSKKTVFLVKSL